MTAPVDVLAVLDSSAISLRRRADRERLREARGAVCQLIAAVLVQIDIDKRYGLGGAAHDLLVAAVARCGGAK